MVFSLIELSNCYHYSILNTCSNNGCPYEEILSKINDLATIPTLPTNHYYNILNMDVDIVLVTLLILPANPGKTEM